MKRILLYFIVIGSFHLSSCSNINNDPKKSANMGQTKNITNKKDFLLNDADNNSISDYSTNPSELDKNIPLWGGASVNANIPLYQIEQRKERIEKEHKKDAIDVMPFVLNEKANSNKKLSKTEIRELLDSIANSNEVSTLEIKEEDIKPIELVDDDEEELKEDDSEKIEERRKKNLNILMNNYKNILNISSSCCVANIAERLRINKVNDKGIDNFLKIDAKEYRMQNNCMVVADRDINQIMNDKIINNSLHEARTDCICNNKTLLRNNIANFYKLYNEDKKFYRTALIYEYEDKQMRKVQHDINESILNIAFTLEKCSN